MTEYGVKRLQQGKVVSFGSSELSHQLWRVEKGWRVSIYHDVSFLLPEAVARQIHEYYEAEHTDKSDK